MAFERIEIAVNQPRKSAGITITQNGKTVVALRKDLVAQARFNVKDTFSAQLGTDEDVGKLRIVKDKAGVACARELKKTGAFFFRLGMVPAIGVTPHKQRPVDARIVEAGIEIDIPPDDGPKLLPPPAKNPDKPTEPAKVARRQSAPVGETVNGITIDLTLDSESITFNGKATEVTTRQAKFVRLLAKPRPAPVAESFLVGALWDGKPPRDAAEQLRLIAADLKGGLAPIGLDLRAVKGVGYQLKDI
ncbi:hypothetical protein [Azospirillum sp.]|uniref:hypothetical protein n=1 Tax=Azospirillum sp. TaxID=34012 RepID=UPI002D3BB273|nr:hypothetical protein [Azospirillum sp.]HYD66124.1 hypothetical protein [Azospirillum sp.]